MSNPVTEFRNCGNGKVCVYFWACNNNNAFVLPDFTKFFQGITEVPLRDTVHQTPNMDNHRWKGLVGIFISLKMSNSQFHMHCILPHLSLRNQVSMFSTLFCS